MFATLGSGYQCASPICVCLLYIVSCLDATVLVQNLDLVTSGKIWGWDFLECQIANETVDTHYTLSVSYYSTKLL